VPPCQAGKGEKPFKLNAHKYETIVTIITRGLFGAGGLQPKQQQHLFNRDQFFHRHHE
jgi:hypothetical protein